MKVFYKINGKNNCYVLETYNSINRIPLSIKKEIVGENSYIELLDENYFIEIGMSVESREFTSFDIIFVNNSIIKIDKNLEIPKKTSEFFNVFFSSMDNTKKIAQIKYFQDILEIVFQQGQAKYIAISDSFYMGIDSNDCLISVLINNIDVKSIFNIASEK